MTKVRRAEFMEYILDEDGLRTPEGIIDPRSIHAARIDRIRTGERHESSTSGPSYGGAVGGAIAGGVIAGPVGTLTGALLGSAASRDGDSDVQIPRTVSATMVIESDSGTITVEVPLDQTGHAERFVAALRKAAGLKS